MQEECFNSSYKEVWVFMDLPEGKRVIGTKWFLEKERWNGGYYCQEQRHRLVAQGYRQEEGVDFDEWMSKVNFCMANHRRGILSNAPVFEDPALSNNGFTELSRLSWPVYDWMFNVLTASRPGHNGLLFVCVAEFQVTPKTLPFHLEAFSDIDYAWETMNRRSTQEDVNILQTTSFLAMQRNNKQLWLSPLEAGICSCCKLLCLDFGCKSNYLIMGFNFMNTENPIEMRDHLHFEEFMFLLKTSIFRFRHTSFEIV
ncbi:putative ribonuclease H-like domain-containing protein [Tanacetum coccineum]|uniref:Ribonuclease H-like domain-containing protein n=1 Tax=Tanacetum coccineum TaxID=301880 RepID=A0ABQ5GTW9_9ASTR